jgi:hypothetical protein
MCCAVVADVVRSTGEDSDNQAGRDASQDVAADECEYSQADASINPAPKDKSRRRGDRQSRERCVPDVIAHIPVR